LDILDRIDAAVRMHDFEIIAQELESSGQLTDYLVPLRSRLSSISLDLPKSLGEYCRKLIKADLVYEEIHKVFSLTESLSILSNAGLEGAREWLEAVAEDIKLRRGTDRRYDMVRADIFGTTYPNWWRS
jgi:hypothetical protein